MQVAACMTEGGVRGGVEKTIVIKGLVQDFDISSIRRLPAHMGVNAENMTAPTVRIVGFFEPSVSHGAGPGVLFLE